MLKKNGGYAAAKAYAERRDEVDEFEADSMDYQLGLMRQQLIGELRDRNGDTTWYVVQPGDWWLLASTGKRGQRPAGEIEIRGGRPWPTKRAAKKDAGVSRAHMTDADGLYVAQDGTGGALWIVRHNTMERLDLAP